jgi:hypothetical protein
MYCIISLGVTSAVSLFFEHENKESVVIDKIK